VNNKTEIEIEFSETLAYNRRSDRFETLCPFCEAMVEMATPQIAAILMGLTERQVFRLVETGEVHFVETDRVVICLHSLSDHRGLLGEKL
jgi:hypothetical protein